MKKSPIRRALKDFRASKCGLKMAIYEALNELGMSGVEFTSEKTCPKALVIWEGHSKTIPVKFLRLNENSMELKNWDDLKSGWWTASFGFTGDGMNFILDPEDVTMAMMAEDTLWEERTYK